MTKVAFRGAQYEFVLTAHARLQMELRGLSESEVLEVVSTGTVKPKGLEGKFWVYKQLDRRQDNLISVAITVERPHLIVITAMVNWRPT